MEDASAPLVKRGRGRPPGSLNKPKPPIRSPEETAILRKHLAVEYAEAIAAYALAADRRRRVKEALRSVFKKEFDEIEQAIKAGEARLFPVASERVSFEHPPVAA